MSKKKAVRIIKTDEGIKWYDLNTAAFYEAPKGKNALIITGKGSYILTDRKEQLGELMWTNYKMLDEGLALKWLMYNGYERIVLKHMEHLEV